MDLGLLNSIMDLYILAIIVIGAIDIIVIKAVIRVVKLVVDKVVNRVVKRVVDIIVVD